MKELYVKNKFKKCDAMYVYVYTVLPRITAWAFISFQQFLTRQLNETDFYNQKEHMLFIICDASD